jgi:hypothetical protein
LSAIKDAKRRARSTGRLTLGRAILAESERPPSGRKHNLPVQRIREIEQLIEARHGPVIPETDDWCLYLEAVHLAKAGQDLMAWCRRWAPWVTALPDLPPIGKHMQKADPCAILLNVTLAERARLDLRTIGACDVGKAERDAIAHAIKLERDRTRQERIRNAEGAVPRESYEQGSAESTKPWLALGMSRATWFRHGLNRTGETSPSPILSKIIMSDGPVSRPDIASAQHGLGGRGGPVAPRILAEEDQADAA